MKDYLRTQLAKFNTHLKHFVKYFREFPHQYYNSCLNLKFKIQDFHDVLKIYYLPYQFHF